MWAIIERFAWTLVVALAALIVLGVLVGSPTAWVLLAVGVIGVLGYGEYLIRRFPTLPAGDSFTVRIQDSGKVGTIEAATVNRSTDCHFQAQGVLTTY